MCPCSNSGLMHSPVTNGTGEFSQKSQAGCAVQCGTNGLITMTRVRFFFAVAATCWLCLKSPPLPSAGPTWRLLSKLARLQRIPSAAFSKNPAIDFLSARLEAHSGRYTFRAASSQRSCKRPKHDNVPCRGNPALLRTHGSGEATPEFSADMLLPAESLIL